MDKKIIDDLNGMIEGENAAIHLLDLLYYNSEFGTLRTRPIISMLITAAKYLRDNLIVLRDGYRGKA